MNGQVCAVFYLMCLRFDVFAGKQAKARNSS